MVASLPPDPPNTTHYNPPVLAKVDALVLLEVVSQEVDNALVKVITTQVSVSAGAQHLKHTVSHLQDGHIKGTTTQVKHEDGLIALALKAIGKGGGCGLVDDTEDLQASNLAWGEMGRGERRNTEGGAQGVRAFRTKAETSD